MWVSLKNSPLTSGFTLDSKQHLVLQLLFSTRPLTHIAGPSRNADKFEYVFFLLAVPVKLKRWPTFNSYVCDTVWAIHSIESSFVINYRIQTGTEQPSALNASLHNIQKK